MNRNTDLIVRIADAKVAQQAAYIYALYAPNLKFLYIGQTCSRQGALGRLAQHLSVAENSTFRRRICDVRRYEEVDIGSVEMLATQLPNRTEFTSKATDYREAVEFNVQYQIIDLVSRLRLRCGIISRVTANAYRRLDFVQRESNVIADRIGGWLPWVMQTSPVSHDGEGD